MPILAGLKLSPQKLPKLKPHTSRAARRSRRMTNHPEATYELYISKPCPTRLSSEAWGACLEACAASAPAQNGSCTVLSCNSFPCSALPKRMVLWLCNFETLTTSMSRVCSSASGFRKKKKKHTIADNKARHPAGVIIEFDI